MATMTVAKERVHKGEMTDRVRTLKSRILDNAPVLSTLRVKFAKEVYESTEGEPAVTRRALVFAKCLDETPIFIDESIIVGNITEQLVAVYPQLEYSCDWMMAQDEYNTQLGPLVYSEEDMERIAESKAYWHDKCSYARALKVFNQVHKGNPDPLAIQQVGVFSDAPIDHALGRQIDYGKVLNKGMKGVIAEVEAKMAELAPGLQEDEKKRTFYNAVLICLNAVIRWADRYARLARQKAGEEKEPGRRQELLQIAEVCERVPANPARTFREAVQAFWFAYAATHVMDIAVSHTAGRIGQTLEPFYQKDVAEGRLTQEEAIELLEFVFLKMQAIVFFRATRYWHGGMGQTNVHVILGGLNAEGEDATGDVDWLLLETQRRVCLIEPTLSVLVHNKMSQEFLLKCVELVKETGLGQPAFMNNDLAVQQVLFNHPGATMEEARSVSIYGCVPAQIAGRTDHMWGTPINMPKLFELALNNGRDPVTGIKIGVETGEIDSFKSYDDIEAAFRKQLQYFLPTYFELIRLSHAMFAQVNPVPYDSAFVENCIEKGKDLTEGGAKYHYGAIGCIVGMIDVANSLAAIKKLVFEEKRLELGELMKAVDANFEGNGYDEIQKSCLDAPKFGNDDLYVDRLAKKWYDILYQEISKFTDSLGRSIIAHPFSVSYHFGFGMKVGAMPSGRPAKVPFADATVSAMPGTDRNGPTALAKSAARPVDATKYSCNHLNMKFHPAALSTREGMVKLLALMKTYMDLGGFHIQFNAVSGETLRDAQLQPDKYRSLVVRVAGFSAFYVLLDKMVQDEIIKRSELRFS